MTEHSIQDPVADDDDSEPTAPPDEDESQATPPAEELPAGEALEARIEEDEETSESSPDEAETIAARAVTSARLWVRRCRIPPGGGDAGSRAPSA